MHELYLEIITPSKKVYSGNIESITIPGTKGSFQILYNHAPILSSFEIGVIKVGLPGEQFLYFPTAGGTVEVLENKVLVLADSLEKAENIDLERAKAALDRANERIANKQTEDIDVERAKAAIARAINRINLVESLQLQK